MTVQILLGPQTPLPNVRQAVESIPFEGPVVAISAGWRDSESETEDLEAEVGRPVAGLRLYQYADEVFASEPALNALNRERQDKLRELQRLYRIRLKPTLAAVRRLMKEPGDPDLLISEQRAAFKQLRQLDRHHLRRIHVIHHEFDQRRSEMHLPAATDLRDRVRDQLDGAGLVIITGGHVAVLLNRIRLFRLRDLLMDKNIVAWSAGAMALSARIVLFHHNAPQGVRVSEVLDAGLGVIPGHIFLPHAESRLDWDNRRRMALFARRFMPSRCCTLDNGSMIRFEQGQLAAVHQSFQVLRNGRKRALSTS